ncbi:MAG TPA: BON domain-containing protein [Blastocatellia bacterium]|nr:BON domain-containing protein [Blastocatellia bacterium]
MNKEVALISGIGLGAGLMYLLDPDRGRRRRAMARDKMVHLLHKADDAVGTTSRDVRNRARGLAAGATSLFGNDQPSDAVLVERVRSKMGRCVSHPGSIEVSASNGRVTLTGQILANEVADLLSCVGSIRGVEEIDNRLEVHSKGDRVPGLQGGVRREGHRFELFQRNWSPTARLIMGASGAGLMLYCSSRKDTSGSLLGTIGFGLLMRSLTNKEMKRLVSFISKQRGDEESARTEQSSENEANATSPAAEKHSTARQGQAR